MGNYEVVLDESVFTKKENGTLKLRGWIYSGGETPEFQVRADKADLSFSCRRYARPDVKEARSDLHFQDDRIGFSLTIPELETWVRQADTLRVRVCCGEERIPLLQKSMQEIEEEYRKEAAILCHIDSMERGADRIYIQGWVISFEENKIDMTLTQEDGQELEDVLVRSMNRGDVMAEYGVTKEECHGFSLDFPRASVKGASIKLSFVTAGGEKTVSLDMKKFDRDNLRIVRLRKLLSANYRERNQEMIRKEGLRGFLEYLLEESAAPSNSYTEYFKRHKATAGMLRKQKRERFLNPPLFSIVVPLYETPLPYLKAMVDSVLAQSYGNWELCLADGSPEDTLGTYIGKEYRGESRIRYKRLEKNGGIAENTNFALSMARGDYIAFLDHDDTIEPDALYHAASVLREKPETELIYSDEDLMDEHGESYYPHLKPDFNLSYLRCINYICHLLIIKTELCQRVGGLDSHFDGAQDYDFLLRCVEQTDAIVHIPRVLYHWRSHSGSTAGNQESKTYAIEAGKRALEAHYQRCALDAEVEYTGTFIVFRTRFAVQGNPKVSVLIPNKDHVEDLEKCITSLEEKATWKNLEIIVIENNSENEETFRYYEELRTRYENVKVVFYQGEFNYSAINNFGASYASGEYYLLLNNDMEVLTPDFLERMLGYCQREHVGIVGAKLYYPDDTIQHAGIVVGLGGFAGHVHAGLRKVHVGYMGRMIASMEISAVTGACMLVRRELYEQLHGLDESFQVALNDVDFCLRAREAGQLVIYAADAELYHYESRSRGYEDTPEKQARFDREIAHFQERHRAFLDAGDPCYNPQLTLEKGDCSLRKSHELLKGRS